MSSPPFVKGGHVQIDECIIDIDLNMSDQIRAAMNQYAAEDGDYLGFFESETGLNIGVKRCSREELAKTHIMHRWLGEGPVRAPQVYGYKEENDKVLMFFEYVEAKRYDDINLKDVITKVIETIEKLQKTGFYHGDLKLRRDSSNILVADEIYLIDFETTKFQSVNNYYDCFHLFVSVEGKLDGLYAELRRGATELVLGLASKHPDKNIDNLPTAFQKLNRMRVSTSCELFLPSKILEELDTQDWDTLWQRQKCEGNILSIKRMESGLDKIDIEDNAEELKPRFLTRITLRF